MRKKLLRLLHLLLLLQLLRTRFLRFPLLVLRVQARDLHLGQALFHRAQCLLGLLLDLLQVLALYGILLGGEGLRSVRQNRLAPLLKLPQLLQVVGFFGLRNNFVKFIL